MSNQNSINVLKTAILLEKRGKAFYEKVAEQAVNKEVKEIFLTMAAEEADHIKFLSDEFVALKNDRKFTKLNLASDMQKKEKETFLTKEIKLSIASADFESAAISAAIDMETKAIELYTKHANEAIDPAEKELFMWLANWEKGHHKILNDLNKELTEEIWNNNQFWPF